METERVLQSRPDWSLEMIWQTGGQTSNFQSSDMSRVRQIFRVRQGITQMIPEITQIFANNIRIWCVRDTICSLGLCVFMCLVCNVCVRAFNQRLCGLVKKYDPGVQGTGLAALKAATGMWGSTSLFAYSLAAHSLFTFQSINIPSLLPLFFFLFSLGWVN